MSQFLLKILCSLTLTTVIYCCVPAQSHLPDDLENTFQELIPVDDMNDTLQIFVELSGQENLEFESDISIIFRNLSDQQLFFQWVMV